MAISIFDLFTIGIGPSSSHTVGPMRAAKRFAEQLLQLGHLPRLGRISIELYGSLGATGKGHGSDAAILMGLEGETPEGVAPETVPTRVAAIREKKCIHLLGAHTVAFNPSRDLVFLRNKRLPLHSNGMRFCAIATDGDSAGAGVELLQRIYYSIGGGFVVDEGAAQADQLVPDTTVLPYPFSSARELLQHTQRQKCSIAEVMLANEKVWRQEPDIIGEIDRRWQAMQACVAAGMANDGILPGGLKVPRRAKRLHQELNQRGEIHGGDPLVALDWVHVYALAVNEENAAGGRVVTAPTNGAAGIIPAVLHYFARHTGLCDNAGIVRFFLTAGAVGILYKERASISGAEVGCQGEVGVACSMAAAGLVAAMGGTPEQVENAAEIGMEHNLGLTCDPIGGLVQIPCIERNAIGAVKAITAARMALRGDGQHKVSLDKVIAAMRQTGMDMMSKYKETSRGGLAINVIEC